ncbi:hypothetical protein B296_00029446 [Ensete ventricosum]|uniref:Uncharacterized protein n=1 Tax=Ensete ventricosum TaxID=4639 RepID=A0A427AGT8_ENSVE|nr:hypothetical protein B296_00029446 [Ensete ventricosum]
MPALGDRRGTVHRRKRAAAVWKLEQGTIASAAGSRTARGKFKALSTGSVLVGGCLRQRTPSTWLGSRRSRTAMQEDGGARCVLPRMTSADNHPLLRRRGGRGGWETESLGYDVGKAAQAINADPARQNRCGACVLLCELMAPSSEPDRRCRRWVRRVSPSLMGQRSGCRLEGTEKRRCREIGVNLVGSVGRGKAQLDSIVGKVVAGGSRKAFGLLLFARGRRNRKMRQGAVQQRKRVAAAWQRRWQWL